MWELIKANPWTAAIGGIILLGAIVGVIVGVVTRGGWKDRGFIHKDGRPLKWDSISFPLAVIFHDSVELTWRSAVAGAARRLELAVGRGLFSMEDTPKAYRWDRPPPMSAGIVAIDSTEPAGELQIDHATTRHRYDTRSGRILAAEVAFPQGGSARKMAVALHEMGHVLGLDHDEQTSSIMYPSLSARVEPGDLSPADAKRLKETYG